MDNPLKTEAAKNVRQWILALSREYISEEHLWVLRFECARYQMSKQVAKWCWSVAKALRSKNDLDKRAIRLQVVASLLMSDHSTYSPQLPKGKKVSRRHVNQPIPKLKECVVRDPGTGGLDATGDILVWDD